LSLIELKHIDKIYNPGENAVHALKNINLTINQNELIAIVGASGSGKSTMLNTLGLLDRPTSGNYIFSGDEVSSLGDDELSIARNQKIGFVFQSFFLINKLNALQNVMLPLLYRNMTIPEAAKKAHDYLDKFSIAHLHHHRPNQLSGGQQQRVALARALVGEPDVILADEPTGALDSKTGQEVMRQFIALQEQEKKTVIIVTHDLGVAKQCNRVIKIADGMVKSDVLHSQEALLAERKKHDAALHDDPPDIEEEGEL
jgi:putative ABC transport system ATP-binding protein